MSRSPASLQPPDLHVVDSIAAASCLVQPLRREILAALVEADSAAGLARRLGPPRQKVNYHLRELEDAGLVALAEERRKGNCIERVMRPVARRFVVSPETLGDVPGPADSVQGLRERFSWSTLVAVAARAIRDLGRLRRRADQTGRQLPTLCLESEVRLASPEQLDLLAEELTAVLAGVIARFHDQQSPRGRRFRLFLGMHPSADPVIDPGPASAPDPDPEKEPS